MHASDLHTPVDLDASEADLHALLRGACHASGVQSGLRDLGINAGVAVEPPNMHA